MNIDSKSLVKNFHLYCTKDFKLDDNFKEELKSLDSESLWCMISESFEYNIETSKRFLQLRFIELLGGEILSSLITLKSVDSSFRLNLIQHGFYNNFDIFDEIILDTSNDDILREYCSNYCSIESLKKLFFDKNQKIREIAFFRVGPKDSFNFMCKDSSFSIRKNAAMLCPHNSEEAFELANDKSKKVIESAINKISLDKVLFLLGNEKINKDKRLLEILKNRLEKICIDYLIKLAI